MGVVESNGAYRLVYDSRHLQADCQESGSAPEHYARYPSMGYLYLFRSLYMGATENARPENAGLENDGQNFSKLWAKLRGLENAGLENAGPC